MSPALMRLVAEDSSLTSERTNAARKRRREIDNRRHEIWAAVAVAAALENLCRCCLTELDGSGKERLCGPCEDIPF
ncbi:hypothetical protein BH11PSE6_BH11PSE6_12150 [soil metagenome]